MAVSFQEVTLDARSPDRDAALVFRDGRLLAVLSCLSPIHGELAGRWFVEAAFGELPRPQPQTFEDLSGVREWLSDVGANGA